MTKPIVVVKIRMLYINYISYYMSFLINNFFASRFLVTHTYLFAMLLLIGLALFLHPGYFCLAYKYTVV